MSYPARAEGLGKYDIYSHSLTDLFRSIRNHIYIYISIYMYIYMCVCVCVSHLHTIWRPSESKGQILDEKQELMYNSSVQTQGVIQKTCRKWLMIEKNGESETERESGKSLLVAWHDISHPANSRDFLVLSRHLSSSLVTPGRSYRQNPVPTQS